jgi:hypothetical protein
MESKKSSKMKDGARNIGQQGWPTDLLGEKGLFQAVMFQSVTHFFKSVICISIMLGVVDSKEKSNIWQHNSFYHWPQLQA